jgi:anti-sigma regulatory factor (Ser/Thr protein kinase)
MADNKNRNNGRHADEEGIQTSVLGEITRPGTAESVPELIQYVLSIAKERNFTPERMAEVETALHAALNHILQTAYKEQTGNIAIVCRHDNFDNLVIAMVDTGTPSNILLADVSFPGEESVGDNERKTTARLIKKLVDNIEYKRVEQENTLTFTVARRLRTK